MLFKKSRIYCDSASTTPLDPVVSKAMKATLGMFANPSSLYREGTDVRDVIISCRRRVAKVLNANQYEIVFTSGGTESNNLALVGVVESMVRSGRSYSSLHIISTEIEHSSILEPLKVLEKKGVRVTRIRPGQDGVVSVSDIKGAITPETVLVSVMYVNNEVGTIQPISKIGRLIEEEKQRREDVSLRTPIFFHSDASQAPLALSLSVDKLGVHLMTLDGHKMYGPKGVGVLYVKRGTDIEPLFGGGGQEGGLRSTTENVLGIVGFTEALALAHAEKDRFVSSMKEVQDAFIQALRQYVPQAVINGSLKDRVPHNINVWIPALDAEFAVIKLDVHGVACSTKSSCLKGEEKSYVLYAMTQDAPRAESSLRFTFLKTATKKEAVCVARALARVLA